MVNTPDTDRVIAIVVNPASGKGKAIKVGNWLSAQLGKREIKHSLFTTEWPQHFADFTEVWVVGGDGTVNFFINRYKDIQIPLAVFKGGTGNDFAWKLYGNIELEEQLSLVLNAKARQVDAAVCNDQLYINSLGIGFDGEVLKSMGTIRWMGGHFGYLWVVIRKIFSFRECRFHIRTAERAFGDKFLLVIINNSSRTGGGFMVAPLAVVNDGKLDMVLCKTLSRIKRLRYLPVIEKGKHLQLPFIVYDKIEGCSIQAEKELFAQLDGELIRSKAFEVKVLAGRFWIKY